MRLAVDRAPVIFAVVFVGKLTQQGLVARVVDVGVQADDGSVNLVWCSCRDIERDRSRRSSFGGRWAGRSRGRRGAGEGLLLVNFFHPLLMALPNAAVIAPLRSPTGSLYPSIISI